MLTAMPVAVDVEISIAIIHIGIMAAAGHYGMIVVGIDMMMTMYSQLAMSLATLTAAHALLVGPTLPVVLVGIEMEMLTNGSNGVQAQLISIHATAIALMMLTMAIVIHILVNTSVLLATICVRNVILPAVCAQILIMAKCVQFA